jgi:hypothetical protein
MCNVWFVDLFLFGYLDLLCFGCNVWVLDLFCILDLKLALKLAQKRPKPAQKWQKPAQSSLKPKLKVVVKPPVN